jgi:uncharacterized membrane protein
LNEVLLILHLLGFGGAVGASVGNFIVTRLVMAAPSDAPVLGKVRFALARASQMALGLLWLTGLILVWSKFGGPSAMPVAFWVKLVLVVIVTAIVAIASLALKRVQQGNAAAGARLPLYGLAASVLLLLIVICAVYAFN